MLELNFELYKRLFLARKAEELIIDYYPENEMKTPMHMSLGQEFIAVGISYALGLENQTLATYRSHAAYIAKTGETDNFFLELYGKEGGVAKGKAGSMHLSAPESGFMGSSAIVASCIPVAVGAAFANKRNKNGKIVGVFFGDGALDEGAFWESLNVACLMELPVLFVCEDNGFAVHTSTRMRQGYKSITNIVSNFECNVYQEDTTDVERVYYLTIEAMESIRKTEKPTFMYFKCYRYLEHVGIYKDFAAGYRSEAEFNEWYKKDSLVIQRKKLLESGYSEEDIQKTEMLIDRQIRNSIKKAKEAPFCSVDELYRRVFYEKD